MTFNTGTCREYTRGLIIPLFDAMFHFLVYFPPFQLLCLFLSILPCNPFYKKDIYDK